MFNQSQASLRGVALGLGAYSTKAVRVKVRERKQMSAKTQKIDSEVLKMLSNENYASIADLMEHGGRVGMLRSSLQRLLLAGLVVRRWCGNARFGKYEYRAG